METQNSKDPNELSEVWRELLGSRLKEIQTNPDALPPVSPLEDDPWSQLLHTQGMAMVDLEKIYALVQRIGLSDVDLEQALQMMQEQSNGGTKTE